LTHFGQGTPYPYGYFASPSHFAQTLRVSRFRFSLFTSAALTLGVLLALWAPVASLYGAATLEALRENPARLWAALPLSLLARTLFWNTFFLCAGTVAISLLLGAVVATFLATREKFSPALLFFAAPLAVSPTLMATAYLEIARTPPARAAASLGAQSTLSVSSIFITAPVLALCFYPIIAFAIGAARRSVPLELTDAARLFGDDWNAKRRVLWPLLAPAALAACGVVAALAMWEMGAPDLLDARTYSVQIYRDFSAEQNTTQAAVDAIPMLFLGALCFVPAWRMLQFYARWETFNAPTAPIANPNRWILAAAILIFVLSPLAPLSIFIQHMQPKHILLAVWSANGTEIWNTIVVATCAAVAIVALSLALAAAWREYSPRTQSVLVALFTTTLLFAPIMSAIAYLTFYNRAALDFVYDSRYGLLTLGLSARFLPMGVLWFHEALRRIPTNLRDAAANMGATPLQIFVSITAPLLAPAIATLFALGWALCASELSLSVLLNAPGGQTLPVPIFNQMHIGATAEVAALSLTLVTLTLGVLLAPTALSHLISHLRHARSE
jgi:iron(III) transport system permease protein